MTTKETQSGGGAINVFEGGNDVLLHAIAHPAVFEAQCRSIADLKRAFKVRGFSTEGSSSMTLYGGGGGKFHSGTPDVCFVRCGRQICYVKTSLSTRPEAEIELVVVDAEHPQPDELRNLRAHRKIFGLASTPLGPGFAAFESGLERGAHDTVVGRVDETIHGNRGTRSIFGSLFRKRPS